jgi:hypothetical protein
MTITGDQKLLKRINRMALVRMRALSPTCNFPDLAAMLWL